MDPVTALGVTCNALQLFETAWKLVSGCQSIYRSEHGASEQSRMLEAIADDILHLSDAIVLNDDGSRPLQEARTIEQASGLGNIGHHNLVESEGEGQAQDVRQFRCCSEGNLASR